MTTAFDGLISKLTADERTLLKNKLSGQIESFFDEHNNIILPNASAKKKFDSLASVLRTLTADADGIPPNGIAYRGHPKWVTPELLQKLQKEAVLRRDKPLDRMDHFLGCGGKVADKLSVSSSINKFVSDYVGPVTSTGIASYLYYDQPGAGIRPHVDTEVFSINLMLMLHHSYSPSQKPSATMVFPANLPPESYHLSIGEVMIMYGSSVIHTRTIIGKGEKVHLLTIGFNPVK